MSENRRGGGIFDSHCTVDDAINRLFISFQSIIDRLIYWLCMLDFCGDGEATISSYYLPSSQGSPVLDGLLHSDFRRGKSIDHLQASLPRCASTQSQLVWASGICCCRSNCLEVTERWSAWSDAYQSLAVSDVCLKLGCFQSRPTSTYSALELSHFMRYINSRLTYYTYLLSWRGRGHQSDGVRSPYSVHLCQAPSTRLSVPDCVPAGCCGLVGRPTVRTQHKWQDLCRASRESPYICVAKSGRLPFPEIFN